MTFHEVYQQYYSRAYRFVKSYVRDAVATEDIVSESMVTLWQQYDESRGASQLPFLYTILRNRSLDYLKSQRRHSSVSDMDDWRSGDLELRIRTLSESPEQIIFSDELRRLVDEALAAMPERTAEIFRLCRDEGKTYHEVAVIYGISVKGVEYHMSQALKSLKSALSDYLPVLCLFALFD